jgi:RNA polymerase sigma-70 factor, ECF subfamily
MDTQLVRSAGWYGEEGSAGMVAFANEASGASGAGTGAGNDFIHGQAMRQAPTNPGYDTGRIVGSFEDFYASSFQSLTTQIYAYTGDLAASQDLVQEAYCRALARWNKLSRYDDPVAWVRKVAFNLAKSRWRRIRTSLRYLGTQREQYMEEPSPDRVVAVKALSSLPAAQRRAMVLYYLADLPISEIATQEGVAVGTVKSWLHRGRTALASLLQDREDHNV